MYGFDKVFVRSVVGGFISILREKIMTENSFIYGDSRRIFLNTSLGCKGKCSYCYLDDIGIGSGIKYIKSEDLIYMFENQTSFVKGRFGTIISIGCYSECWDDDNKKQTIKLIENLIKYGNYIQLSTKCKINLNEIKHIDSLLKFKNQLSIFVSLPTISQSSIIEIGTDCVNNRISNFLLKEKVKNIDVVLYIKPVLKNITIKDIEKYQSIIEQYEMYTVVGNYLSINKKDKQLALVGEGKLYENESSEINLIVKRLNKYGKIFTHSTQVIEQYRNY